VNSIPSDVYGAKYDEFKLRRFFRKIHHLKTKTKTLQRIGEFSVKSGNPKSTGDIAYGNRLSVPVM
jgi:hypothetical protein